MTRKPLLLTAIAVSALALSFAGTSAGDPPVPPPPPPPWNPPPTPREPDPKPAQPPVTPAPAPAPAPQPAQRKSPEEIAGERCIDEAARYLAKGAEPARQLMTMHCDIDYAYDDGSNHDERHMAFWFRNPDGFRADTVYAGRDSTLLLLGERGFMIRDRIRVTDLNNSPTMKEALPMLRNFREILKEVARLMVPAGLKGPGARFVLAGTIADPRATGGQWFKVVRTAPNEGDITFFFGSAPRKDGQGLRAVAPDRLIMGGAPGSKYAGDEYRLEDWVHEGDPKASFEATRYPRTLRLYAIGIDPENKPTMRATINSLEVNVAPDPDMFTDPLGGNR